MQVKRHRSHHAYPALRGGSTICGDHCGVRKLGKLGAGLGSVVAATVGIWFGRSTGFRRRAPLTQSQRDSDRRCYSTSSLNVQISISHAAVVDGSQRNAGGGAQVSAGKAALSGAARRRFVRRASAYWCPDAVVPGGGHEDTSQGGGAPFPAFSTGDGVPASWARGR